MGTTPLLTETEIKELNKFGALELTASHTYMHLSNRMKTLSYFGATAFFSSESDDERNHYRKLEDFMNDMNCELEVKSLDAVTSTTKNIKEALEMAYEMEAALLEEYEKTYKMDLSPKVIIFIQEFISIQAAAVGEYGDLLARLALTDNMLLFDQDLAEKG